MEQTFHSLYVRSLPEYLSMGMSPRDFWEAPVDLCAAYRAKSEIDARKTNVNHWEMGAYVYDALIRVHPAFNGFSKGRVKPYMELPFGEKEKVEQEREEMRRRQTEKAKSVMEIFMVNFNEKLERKRSLERQDVEEVTWQTQTVET